MSDFITLTTIGLCALYILFVAVFLFGMLQKSDTPPSLNLSVSILVPARNEANNIDACLKALSVQNYPVDQLEIIVINDRSTDETEARINTWTNCLPNLRCISVTQQDYNCPKKNALWQGIKQAQNDILLTTDADCRPGPNWVTSTVEQFAPNVGMVIGHAPLEQNKTMLSGLLSLQALIVSILAAGSAGIGFPLTCTGRNLAFRRQAFDEVEGYKSIGHIIGGDDVLFMNQIKKTSWKIRFNTASEAFVPSAIHPDNLIHRQVRYQSKTIHYAIPTLLLAIAVYIFHAVLFTLPLTYFIDVQLFRTVGLCLTTKFIADAALLFVGAHQFQSLKLLVWFPLLEMLIIPYIVIICALGIFLPFKWK
jgi:poly-beta-1,6-N-acetyl-D-glucosamine synthase